MTPFGIFHPSDFSPESEVAPGHALRLPMATRTPLRMLHVAPVGEPRPRVEFPAVRETLEGWRLPPAGAPPEAVSALAVRFRATGRLRPREPAHG